MRSRLPVRPSVLAGISLAILVWLALTSASTLLLWRSHDRATASLESAVEDLSTSHELLQEVVYDTLSFRQTQASQYAARYDRQRPLLLSALDRSQADLAGNADYLQRLDRVMADTQVLLQSLDQVRQQVQVDGSADSGAPGAGGASPAPLPAAVTDTYSADETASVRNPRDAILTRLTALQNDVRDGFYTRRGTAADSLHRALLTLFFSIFGTLVLGALILGLLAIISRSHERAELDLQQSEHRYRDLLSHSNEMIAILAGDGTYDYANPAWLERLGGHAPGGVAIDCPVASLAGSLPPAEADRVLALQRRALNGETLHDIPLRLTRPDGQPLVVQASLSLRGGDGEAQAVRWICRDITARDAHERRLRAQLAAGQVMAMAQTPQEALPKILESLGTAFGSDLVDVWLADEAQEKLRRAFLWARDPQQASHLDHSTELERGDGLPGCVLENNAGCWQAMLEGQPLFFPTTQADAPKLINGWGVPVPFQGKVLATLQFYQARPVFRDEELLATLEAIGVLLGQFLARCGQESQLDVLHRQTDSILNSVADGIVGIDSEGCSLFANPAAAALLQMPANEMDHQGVHEMIHGNQPADQQCHGRCALMRAMHSGEGGSGNDLLYRANGSPIPIEFTLSKLTHEGEVVGSVLTLRDVTERHALDRMKDEFVSTVSHELRTPLTSIRGSLGLLDSGRMGELNTEAAKLLRIAVSNTDRLIRLINDILDLDRMESGRAPLQMRIASMRDLLQQSVETMRSMADSSGIELRFEPEDEAVAEADADRMTQVFTNLLSNAIKFSPQDSEIHVAVEAGKHEVAICISDQGRGIPEDKLDSVFDRFQQVDASDSRQKGGTGLGLAICRTILEQHGGRIWAERNPDRGMTFRIVLPRTQAATAPAPVLAPERATRSEMILICDENSFARSAARQFLERHNYHVLEAATGPEALQLARQYLPQAVLLDAALPEKNGWRVLHELKLDPATAGVPVIVLSMTDGHVRANANGNGHGHSHASESALMNGLGMALHSATPNANVLLVEDDEDLAQVIGMTFERNGIRIRQVATLHEATHICETSRPDLIVLDLNLPDGDGMELLAWIRRHPRLHGLPLLVYSGRELTQAERATLRSGDTLFLEKALVSPEEVEQAVLALLHPEKFPAGLRSWDSEGASI